MTSKERAKNCINCGTEFIEGYRESNAQWDDRLYCGMKCNNTSKERITDIFVRLERFQKKKRGCWVWLGSKDGAGYGTISNRLGSGNSPEKAHRVSYEKSFGKIPDGLYVCHKCDNPGCTNPKHLFLGSQKDNMKDCSKKGRLNNKSLSNLIPGRPGCVGAKKR